MLTKRQILEAAGYDGRTKKQILEAAGYKPGVGRPRMYNIKIQLCLHNEMFAKIPMPRSEWIRAAITEKLAVELALSASRDAGIASPPKPEPEENPDRYLSKDEQEEDN
ncbi:MAG: hypothetical protein WBM07_10880 [Chitinivibrionales bacterium]